MKNSKFAALILIVAVAFSSNAFAQKFKDLDKSPMDVSAFPSSYKESDKKVKVVYSRPQLNGRDVAKLAPNGEIWRTGANEAAEITFYYPAKIGNDVVKPGTYTLFTIPGNKGWTIILNSASNVWGAYTYNEELNIVKLEAEATKGKESLEAFSIVFEGEKNEAVMYMGWGETLVKLPITFMDKEKSKKLKGTKY
ncbi:DUF2911 domain-containing protein [Patiriisocius marinus]|uniref:DUF2911 domain-containing protein n=1 Tax=Patiriisocius marinus TaxID=1397112 RepID=A0A5J4J456_9FLAO|nr:DUF2911 domain-containing protein [Patiriisocius marinus]GER60808.1 hypothetical protein ULMA_29160 [Patiriisocius marinus]